MTTFSKGAVAALATVVVVTGPLTAGAGVAEDLKLAPRHGVSFDVGSKRAVSYFLAEGGICNLTVLMAEGNAEDEVKGAATRVTIPVIPAKSARFDTAEGKTLEFKCAPSAQAMSVRVLDKITLAPKG